MCTRGERVVRNFWWVAFSPLQCCITNDCGLNAEHKATVIKLLPEGYDYMFLNIYMINTMTCSFSCEFKIQLCSEVEARKWVSDYNEVTKETMVYTRSKRCSGKHVVTKLFMKCHHNQRSTGKHCKSTKS